MLAIRTRYLGPTDTRGSRVRATCVGRSVVVPWDHGTDSHGNHRAAAVKLAERLNPEPRRDRNVLGACDGAGRMVWLVVAPEDIPAVPDIVATRD